MWRVHNCAEDWRTVFHELAKAHPEASLEEQRCQCSLTCSNAFTIFAQMATNGQNGLPRFARNDGDRFVIARSAATWQSILPRNTLHRQRSLQRIPISHPRCLQYGGLGLQALEFGINKLQADELGFDSFGEGFDFVGLVDGNGF